MSNTGKIWQIIGPVIDVTFEEKLPAILSALKIKDPGRNREITCEVASHLGNNMIRSIALAPTEGLVRGMAVSDTGAPIQVPVGKNTLGRVMDLLGNPVDGLPPVVTSEFLPIHRSPPTLSEQEPTPRVFQTGI